ncbi:MAG TPA: flagellar assembly protein FliW [Bryobacteraceae bacterium]|jgi:flagellar assembly factor FliW|nr:flagellar assembly protein FliW [Bryobacteraceae bacterium]
MPVCQTKFHGSLEYEPEQVLQIPQGLFGFASETEFLLLEIPSLRPLVFIQSTRTANLCFLSLPVQVVDANYRLALREADIREFGYSAERNPEIGQNLLCLTLLTIGQKQAATANLQAPVLIDIERHRGMQAIVSAEYSHRVSVTPERLRPAC